MKRFIKEITVGSKSGRALLALDVQKKLDDIFFSISLISQYFKYI